MLTLVKQLIFLSCYTLLTKKSYCFRAKVPRSSQLGTVYKFAVFFLKNNLIIWNCQPTKRRKNLPAETDTFNMNYSVYLQVEWVWLRTAHRAAALPASKELLGAAVHGKMGRAPTSTSLGCTHTCLALLNIQWTSAWLGTEEASHSRVLKNKLCKPPKWVVDFISVR